MVLQPETIAELETQRNQFSFTGVLLVLGVIFGMIVMGWGAGVLRAKRSNFSAGGVDWRARYAWVVAASYLPLIAVGGLVTSTESGLAVPDSVTTYGSISILFPISLMDETRIYLEHSHRIFGTFAGLATIVLVIRMFGAPANWMPRVMSVVLLAGVIVQGVMGALRVSEESQGLATLHGVLAQLVFALAIVTGVVCSRRWESLRPSDDAILSARKARLFLLLTTIGLCIQLVFGSMTRHMDSGHALMSHIGFSFVVVLLAIVAGAMCIRVGKIDRGVEGGAGAIRPYGAVIHGLVILQFTMGWGALAMTRTGEEGHPELPTASELASAHGIRVGETIVTSSHHLIGALLLATAVGALMWAIRIASRARSC
ncbi:MAG: COX15/CtaA family protein [Phycisphaerales bacterium]|nr:COX15/CtaA family protein [Phycisphaerales bacterium]